MNNSVLNAIMVDYGILNYLRDEEYKTLSPILSPKHVKAFLHLALGEERDVLERYECDKQLGVWSNLAGDLMDFVNLRSSKTSFGLSNEEVCTVGKIIEAVLGEIYCSEEQDFKPCDSIRLIHVMKYLGYECDFTRLFQDTSIFDPKANKVIDNFISLSANNTIYYFYLGGVQHGIFEELTSWDELKRLVMNRVVHGCALEGISTLYPDLVSLHPKKMEFLLELGYNDEDFLYIAFQQAVPIPNEFMDKLESVLNKKSVEYISTLEQAVEEWNSLSVELQRVVYRKFQGNEVQVGHLPLYTYELNLALIEAGHNKLGLTGRP